MPKNTVALIGYQDRINLGLGYIAAVLERAGYPVAILDFRLGAKELTTRLRIIDPVVVGFSLIFQYYTPSFADLAHQLRQGGLQCLFCAGGHYPSLRPEEVLTTVPDLDCVVRFEGELTLLELVQRLSSGEDWHDVRSLAYRDDNGRVVQTALRPLIADLDALPYPIRRGPIETCLGIPVTSILASRGCVRECTFCSIRRFYSVPPGRLRRTRRPDEVVAEMQYMSESAGTRIFLFQDDDFALTSRRDREWAREFISLLKGRRLEHQYLWKISCRSDEVQRDILSEFRDAGLGYVYLGIESGNPLGLNALNKQIRVEQNREAVAVLKELEIAFEFGFMLFDPTSTLELVLENVRFLRDAFGDGVAVIPFCKTLPYAGTEIEAQLKSCGRLIASSEQPDYAFLDPRLELLYTYLQNVFAAWAISPDALFTRIKSARFEVEVAMRLLLTGGWQDYAHVVSQATRQYNNAFCRVVEEAAEIVRCSEAPSVGDMIGLSNAAAHIQRQIAELLDAERRGFLVRNRARLGFDQRRESIVTA